MAALVVLLILALVSFLVFAVHASASIHSNFYLHAINRVPTRNSLLLTFDDGPDPVNTPRLLDTLKQLNAKALFFVVGEKAKNNPELIKRIMAEGHLIGNHTYCHNPFYAFHSVHQIVDELQQTNAILEQNNVTTNLFRPPLGITNPAIAKAVKQLNLTTIGWSIRSFDTRKYETREKVLSRVKRQINGGDIVLLHDRMSNVDWLAGQIVNFARDVKGITNFDNNWLNQNAK